MRLGDNIIVISPHLDLAWFLLVHVLFSALLLLSLCRAGATYPRVARARLACQ